MANTVPALAPLAYAARVVGPALLALGTTWAFDRACRRKGLMPPGFRNPWRRLAGSALVFSILWVGIFAPLGALGLPQPKLDLTAVSTPRLFLLHGLLLGVIAGWFLLGFAGVGVGGASSPEAHAAGAELPAGPVVAPEEAIVTSRRRPSLGRQLAAQMGLVAPSVSREVVIGLALGACAWGAVLLALFAAALAIYALGGEKALPKPSAIVPWMASLPLLVRLGMSLSAGFVEELFFRGFLQPRFGIALSTGCFVLAHLSYGQPFMLLGITLLSLIYAFLVRWRQTIWPAIAAHALFDGVQLLVIIPLAMRWVGKAPGMHGGIW